MTADELRAEYLALTLQRLAEGLGTIVLGVDVDTLKALDFEGALKDFVAAWEKAENDADTGVAPLPMGVGWEQDETTEPIGVHNRSNP
jgi:hypothetical protein